MATKSPPDAECAVCGFVNRAGTLACDNCGSLLINSSQKRQGTRDLYKGGGSDLDEAMLDLFGEKKEEVPLNTGEYVVGMEVHLQIADRVEPVVITPQHLNSQVVIGRRDPITQQSPQIDLDKYAAYHNGVSRKHAALQIINGNLMVSDLGSSNGTQLNGNRLNMRQPHMILNGDTIQVGQVKIVVQFKQVD